jgi:hypothetical protein
LPEARYGGESGDAVGSAVAPEPVAARTHSRSSTREGTRSTLGSVTAGRNGAYASYIEAGVEVHRRRGGALVARADYGGGISCGAHSTGSPSEGANTTRVALARSAVTASLVLRRPSARPRLEAAAFVEKVSTRVERRPAW